MDSLACHSSAPGGLTLLWSIAPMPCSASPTLSGLSGFSVPHRPWLPVPYIMPFITSYSNFLPTGPSLPPAREVPFIPASLGPVEGCLHKERAQLHLVEWTALRVESVSNLSGRLGPRSNFRGYLCELAKNVHTCQMLCWVFQRDWWNHGEKNWMEKSWSVCPPDPLVKPSLPASPPRCIRAKGTLGV